MLRIGCGPFLLACFIAFCLPSTGSTQVLVSQGQSTGESTSDLRFVREPSAPTIAQESFHFRPDGWIIGRVRAGNSDFWGLTPPQAIKDISFFEPEKASMLNGITDQITKGGAYRSQTEAILGSAGFTGTELDAALEAGNVVWSTGMQWANVMQVGLDDAYVFYVAFYSVHEHPNRAENVPVDAAIVLRPGMEPRRAPDRFFAFSAAAEEFRRQAFVTQGDAKIELFARCAQQFLLDAGFNPRGVDGAPGNGARAALADWSSSNDYPMPPFSLEYAFYICQTLTAAPSHFEKVSGGFVNVSSIPFSFGLNGADCASSASLVRSNPIAKHGGLYAHPVSVCRNGVIVTTVIYWSATNAEGTSLTSAIADPQGNSIPSNSGFDADSNSNWSDIGIVVEGKQFVCRIVKPAGGIAPEHKAECG